MEKSFKDITGQRFGRLVAIERIERRKCGLWKWRCKCDCGNDTIVCGSHLRDGSTQSCGCYQKERCSVVNTTHGLSLTARNFAYHNMKARCYTPTDQDYFRYGARGITICDRWLGEHGFETFLVDMGMPPKGKTLDRIDNDGPYSPENCRWATPKEQAHNRRTNHILTYKGKNQCIAGWAAELEINENTILSRLKQGCSTEEALSSINHTTGLPLNTPALITIRGESLLIKDWLKKTGTNKSTYYRRLKRGLTPEQALFPSKNISVL